MSDHQEVPEEVKQEVQRLLSEASKKPEETVKVADITTAREWKTKARQGTDLPVPSGNVALVRNPGMRQFLETGVIPNELMDIVEKALKRGEAPDFAKVAQDDPKKTKAVLDMIDNVVRTTVIQPVVWPVPSAEECEKNLQEYPDSCDERGRLEDRLYVDEVDFEDRLYIFQWVSGGTRDLEQFRSELRATLADLPGGDEVRNAAERLLGSNTTL